MTDFFSLPPNLPEPHNEGACDHLPGSTVPSVVLESTGGGLRDLGEPRERRLVLFCYPMMGRPGHSMPEGWDAIPGARGCTPEACGFRDLAAALAAAGADVAGLSAESPEAQRQAVTRLHLPFPLLSDRRLQFAKAMGLPTFEIDGRAYIRRLTLVIRSGRVERVFYPVFPPDRHADAVLRCLETVRGQ